MTITWVQAVGALTLGSTIGSALFWGVLLLGRLIDRTRDMEKRLDAADEWHGKVDVRLEDHGRQLYELRGERRQS